MAEYLADPGRFLDASLACLGIHGVSRFQAMTCVLGATTFLLLCVAVRSAARMAFLRCSGPR